MRLHPYLYTGSARVKKECVGGAKSATPLTRLITGEKDDPTYLLLAQHPLI
jgi:hypothetical protein